MRWQRVYGGSGYDWADGVALASDGSVIVAGGTYSFGAGNTDAWILKLPPNGSVKWRYSKITNAKEMTTNCSVGEAFIKVIPPQCTC